MRLPSSSRFAIATSSGSDDAVLGGVAPMLVAVASQRCEWPETPGTAWVGIDQLSKPKLFEFWWQLWHRLKFPASFVRLAPRALWPRWQLEQTPSPFSCGASAARARSGTAATRASARSLADRIT